MNTTLINKSKWFWPWQDDKEEAWLGDMARQGLHLNKPGYFGHYTFTRGNPQEIAYRLDFVTSANKTADYFQLFLDAGWEHVSEMGGWQYWRKEVKAGDTPEIFTDVESKVQKHRRLLGFLAIVFFPIVLGLRNLTSLPLEYRSFREWTAWFFYGLEIFFGIIFFLYIYIFIRLGMRIRQLRHQ